jgi:hypothetical protein
VGFVIKCLLRLNGWIDMGLVTHEWLVAYVLPNKNVVGKSSCKTQDVLLWKWCRLEFKMNFHCIRELLLNYLDNM